MHVCASRSDMVEMIPIFFCGLIGLAIVAGVFYLFVKKQDDNKELITLKVKVLEKPIQQGNVECLHVRVCNGQNARAVHQQDLIGNGEAGALVTVPKELTACTPRKGVQGFLCGGFVGGQ